MVVQGTMPFQAGITYVKPWKQQKAVHVQGMANMVGVEAPAGGSRAGAGGWGAAASTPSLGGMGFNIQFVF